MLSYTFLFAYTLTQNIFALTTCTGPSTLFNGAIANSLATLIGHYPWFLTYNYLSGDSALLCPAPCINIIITPYCTSHFSSHFSLSSHPPHPPPHVPPLLSIRASPYCSTNRYHRYHHQPRGGRHYWIGRNDYTNLCCLSIGGS